MSLRLSACSTTSCQAFSCETFSSGVLGEVFSSGTAIEFSLVPATNFRSRCDRGRLSEAPKLDAIRRIVNMFRLYPWSAPDGDAIGRPACDRRSNKDIGEG